MTSRRTRERLIARLREKGIANMRVLDTILATPRHLFLDEALSHRAYEDTSLPIGFNQTISQPYTVARMTEALLAGGPLQSVLEVGTGSGYQTAVLAQLVDQLYSVERIRPLQEKARSRLQRLKLYNVMLRHSDGGMGWPEKGPFDGILVTAAPAEVPPELLEQLAPGGRLVIPVGGDLQQLKLVIRHDDDNYTTEVLEGVKFVPLLSGLVR
ncbi:protein-L-isoaspartate(D-aspartate) O-methyltransferase [Nitrincola iocasae]|uniref:Protein-L-isoaspartate O-methyltransferase n=2 Tax=Nitrincola iocasae TaxID=2614693 RepID=A0A5J6LIT2_9GAMM|nr:protein-L-isoaspartate(D-aspartate) O-methyltransferase [Nitrincola iocasae]